MTHVYQWPNMPTMTDSEIIKAECTIQHLARTLRFIAQLTTDSFAAYYAVVRMDDRVIENRNSWRIVLALEADDTVLEFEATTAES